MRIAFFTNCYKPIVNGVVIAISLLKEAYEKKGHQTYIFAPQVDDYIDEEKNIFRYRSVNLTHKVKYPLAIPLSFRAKRTLTQFNPDIIHIHHPFLLSSPAIIYGRELGIPRILTLHTQYEKYTHYFSPIPERLTREVVKKIIVNLACKIDCFTTPSSSMKELIKKHGIENRIEVIPNAIKLDVFREKDERKCTEIREKYKIAKDEKIILYLGRVAKEKSIDKLLEAIALLQRRGVDKVKLLIVGKGPALEELQELAKSLQIEKETIFTGEVKNEEVKHYYKIAYLFATASLTETFGIVIIEALASGIPVLAIKAPGIVDIITDGVEGLLVENEVVKLTDALEKVVRNPQLREELSRGALKTSTQYDINIISDRMLSLYQEMIEQEKDRNLKKDLITNNAVKYCERR